MSTSATIPIFDPQGVLRDVPQDQFKAAVGAGGKPAVRFQAPDGKIRYVPASMTADAVKAGGKMLPIEQQDVQHPGFWTSLGADLGGMAKGAYHAAVDPLTDTHEDLVRKLHEEQAADKAAENSPERQAHGAFYRNVSASAAKAVGVNVPGMEQSAAEGDVAGVMGHAVAPLAVAAITKGVEAGAPVIAKASAPAVRAFARGVNKGLEKAPGTIGAGIGATAGGYVGGHLGSEVGAGAGYVLGKEVLPQVRIPGEGFGLPDRVEGGPVQAPTYQPVARQAPPLPEAFQPQAKGPVGTADNPFRGPVQSEAVRQSPPLPEAFDPPARPLQSPVGTVDNPFQGKIPTDATRQAPPLPEAFQSRGPQYQPPVGTVDNPIISQEAVQQAVEELGPKTPTPNIRARAAEIQQQLNESLGAQQLKPNVPLREQVTAKAPEPKPSAAKLPNEAPPKLPEGFTPALGPKGEPSAALRGYKYNPETREFESITSGGQHYIHGDVGPEAVAKFESSASKGKAWGELRNSPGVTPVAKVIDGKRVATKPISRAEAAPTDDLMPKMPESLKEVPKPAQQPKTAESDLTSQRQQSSNSQLQQSIPASWKEFTAQNMSRAMKEAGSHGAAMKQLGEEWEKFKNGDLALQLKQSVENVEAQKASGAPRFVYRARDVGESGVPVNSDLAQATSDPSQAMRYAETGQRGAKSGEVVKIDLSKMKPSDYVVKTHPSGAKWIQFTRPLGEDEVSAYTGKHIPPKAPTKSEMAAPKSSQQETGKPRTAREISSLQIPPKALTRSQLQEANA